ncbi:MAG: WG repeat-containing protein [Saprospiraceae bacterium]
MKRLVTINFFLIIFSLLISIPSRSQDLLIPYKKGKLFGFANENGELVIPADYEKVFPFDKNGFAMVSKFGLYGQIDKNGKEVIPYIFERPFNENRIFLESETGKRTALDFVKMDLPASEQYFIRNLKSGELLSCRSRPKSYFFAYAYDYIGAEAGIFKEGMSKVILEDTTANFIDTNGNFILKKNYPDVAMLSKNTFAIRDNSNQIALMTRDEKILTNYDYSQIARAHKSPYILLTLANSKDKNNLIKTVADLEGKIVFKKTYRKLEHLAGEYFAYQPEGQQNWTIINTKEDSVATLDYYEFRNQGAYFSAKKGGKSYLFNDNLEVISVPFNYIRYDWNSGVVITATVDSSFVYFPKKEKPLSFFGPEWQIKSGNLGSNEIILSETNFGRTFYLLDLQGNFILEDPFEKITPLNINQSYHVGMYLNTGVYDIQKGWIIPYESRYQCIAVGMEGQPLLKNVQFNKGFERYLYTENYVEKKLDDYYRWETKRFPSEDPEFLTYITPGNETFQFAKSYNAELKYAGNVPLFSVIQGREMYYYKTDASEIIPKGFSASTRDGLLGEDGKVAMAIYGNDQIGVINQDGNWIIEPEPAGRPGEKRIEMEDNGLIHFIKSGAIALYNVEGKKLSTSNQKVFRFYGKQLIGISEGESRSDSRTYLYNLNMERVFPEPLTVISSLAERKFIIKLTDKPESPLIAIDDKGEKLFELPYSNADFTMDKQGRIIVFKDKNAAVLDSTGNVIVPLEYDNIRFYYPFFLLEKAGKLDLLTLKNKIAQTNLPPRAYVSFKSDSHAVLTNDNQYHIFDNDGKFINTVPYSLQGFKEDHPLKDHCFRHFTSGHEIYVSMKTGRVFME